MRTAYQAVRARWNQAGAERWAATALAIFAAVVLIAVTVRSVRADPVRTLQIAAPFVFVFGVGIVGGLRKGQRGRAGDARVRSQVTAVTQSPAG